MQFNSMFRLLIGGIFALTIFGAIAGCAKEPEANPEAFKKADQPGTKLDMKDVQGP